jgi:hypothetical protein
MGDRSSEEPAQRQAIWSQWGNAIKVQMESLMPGLSKITKAERIEEMVLMHVCYLALKPFQTQTHIVSQGLLHK